MFLKVSILLLSSELPCSCTSVLGLPVPGTYSYHPEDDCQSSFFFRSTTSLSWKTSFSSCQQMIFCEKFWTIEWLILDDWVSFFWWLELMDVFGKISGHLLYHLIRFDFREIKSLWIRLDLFNQTTIFIYLILAPTAWVVWSLFYFWL